MSALPEGITLYRHYLQSPVWKAKRQEALSYYGCVCSRCKCYGTDVHHKTYERVGGNERMEDLEVLCRECHDAHHLAERCSVRIKSGHRTRKPPTRDCIARTLTPRQRAILGEKFGVLQGEIFSRITTGLPDDPILLEASRMLGVTKSRQTSYVNWHRGNRSGQGRGLEWILGNGVEFRMVRNPSFIELKQAQQFRRPKQACKYLARIGVLRRLDFIPRAPCSTP